MPRLTKIYTRTGDDGTTGLATGQRVFKDDLSVEAYGSVDEANTAIGLAVVAAEHSAGNVTSLIAPILRAIQHDLFDLGADLATPITLAEPAGTRLRIVAQQVQRLELLIDEHNEPLRPLENFVLPGGSQLAAHLHHARAVVRRAERLSITLLRARPAEINPEAIRYLNRLSDLLFVLSRVANDSGSLDVLWIPGVNRK